MPDETQWHGLACRLKLSPRELQIVRGVFRDKKERAIAAEYGISAHTVHTHLERLYRKLGVSSRVSLIVRICGELVISIPAGQGNALGHLVQHLGGLRNP